jgi:hypothetical protein
MQCDVVGRKDKQQEIDSQHFSNLKFYLMF